MDFSEKWGTDVDEAVRLALIDLKLTIDEVEVTVLEEPSKGFFGIGSRLAKVRVEKKKFVKPQPKEEVKKAEQKTVEKKIIEKKITEIPKDDVVKPTNSKAIQVKEVKENIDIKESNKKPERKRDRVSQEKPADLVPVKEHTAISFLKEVTEKMGLALEITGENNEDCIYIDIEGKDSGTIIGKRGQTLDAIQYLTSLVVNKDKEKYMRVVVDAENYRSKREKTLEQLANRLADKVVKSKKSVRLEPMNPYERKVIHATLQTNPAVTTRSEGEEPYRRVIIELK